MGRSFVCVSKLKPRVQWPSKEVLKSDYEFMSLRAIGEKYGCSASAVLAHFRRINLRTRTRKAAMKKLAAQAKAHREGK